MGRGINYLATYMRRLYGTTSTTADSQSLASEKSTESNSSEVDKSGKSNQSQDAGKLVRVILQARVFARSSSDILGEKLIYVRIKDVWENPDLFIPERFLLVSTSHIKARDFEFIPFGSGRRIFPGQPLATRMLYLMVGSLVHWFDWKLEDGVTPENLNMDEKFGISVEKAHPLRAVPLLT